LAGTNLEGTRGRRGEALEVGEGGGTKSKERAERAVRRSRGSSKCGGFTSDDAGRGRLQEAEKEERRGRQAFA